MFLIKQQLTTSNKVHKQSSVTEVFSYNIVLGERPKILLCHQPFFYHLSGRQLSMMHAIITVSEANKAYAYANLFSRRKVRLVDYLGCWCFEKPHPGHFLRWSLGLVVKTSISYVEAQRKHL